MGHRIQGLTHQLDGHGKHVCLIVRQLSMKAGWWDAPLSLQGLAEEICMCAYLKKKKWGVKFIYTILTSLLWLFFSFWYNCLKLSTVYLFNPKCLVAKWWIVTAFSWKYAYFLISVWSLAVQTLYFPILVGWASKAFRTSTLSRSISKVNTFESVFKKI